MFVALLITPTTSKPSLHHDPTPKLRWRTDHSAPKLHFPHPKQNPFRLRSETSPHYHTSTDVNGISGNSYEGNSAASLAAKSLMGRVESPQHPENNGDSCKTESGIRFKQRLTVETESGIQFKQRLTVETEPGILSSGSNIESDGGGGSGNDNGGDSGEDSGGGGGGGGNAGAEFGDGWEYWANRWWSCRWLWTWCWLWKWPSLTTSVYRVPTVFETIPITVSYLGFVSLLSGAFFMPIILVGFELAMCYVMLLSLIEVAAAFILFVCFLFIATAGRFL